MLSGAPSTVWTLARHGNLLDSTAAAGTMLLPRSSPRWRLLVAGGVAHVFISLWWGAVLAEVLPPRRRAMNGTLAGLGIAALDLGVIARRYPAIRELPTGPQVLDHLAFGAVVGWTLSR